MPAPITDTMTGQRQFVIALARGLEVLRCFSASQPELGSKEIAERIGLPQPTVWRLCHTLVQLGYLVPAATPGKLRAGVPMMALGAAALTATAFTELLRPHLQHFIQPLPGAVVLAERHQATMIWVLRCDGDADFVLKLPAGSSLSLYDTTSGQVCLAGMPEAMREQALATLARRRPDALAPLRERLRSIDEALARHGYVSSLGERGASVSMAAVPLLSADQRRAFTLLCGGPAFSLTATLIAQRIGPGLVELARTIAPALPNAIPSHPSPRGTKSRASRAPQ